MVERIYLRGGGDEIEPLFEEAFAAEDELQALIAEHPELLDGEQIRPGDPRRWVLVAREQGIAEAHGGGARWAVDCLIVDQDAAPTLVEVKRGSNPELRRTVVGQMLEYAAHAAQTWTADELRSRFEESAQAQGRDPAEVLGELLAEEEPDADRFWEAAAGNLAAKRMRLLFAADEIPDPLRRTAAFLNAQMPHIEVLAVEIKQFRGKTARALVPRVHGRAASPGGGAGRRQKLTRDSFLEDFADERERAAAARLLAAAEEHVAKLEWGKSGVTIRVRCSSFERPVTLAWLYPPSKPGKQWYEAREFTFGTAVLKEDPGPDDELRAVLQEWVDVFAEDPFAERVSGKWLQGWVVGHEEAAQNIDRLAARLTGVLQQLRALDQGR